MALATPSYPSNTNLNAWDRHLDGYSAFHPLERPRSSCAIISAKSPKLLKRREFPRQEGGNAEKGKASFRGKSATPSHRDFSVQAPDHHPPVDFFSKRDALAAAPKRVARIAEEPTARRPKSSASSSLIQCQHRSCNLPMRVQQQAHDPQKAPRSARTSPALISTSHKPKPTTSQRPQPASKTDVSQVAQARRTGSEEEFNFSAGMPHLMSQRWPLQQLAPSAQAALQFVLLADLPPQASTLGSSDPQRSPSRPPEAPLLPPLPAGSDKPTLVLDLDETLVHCKLGQSSSLIDPSMIVYLDCSGEVTASVYFRPQMRRFLDEMKNLFEIVVFTASTAQYADQVLNQIDPSGTLIHHRLYRDQCTMHSGGFFVKELSRLGRDLSRTILVDNSLVSCAANLDHGVILRPWFEDPCDNELHVVGDLLRECLDFSEPFPIFLSSKFGWRIWVNELRKRLGRCLV